MRRHALRQPRWCGAGGGRDVRQGRVGGKSAAAPPLCGQLRYRRQLLARSDAALGRAAAPSAALRHTRCRANAVAAAYSATRGGAKGRRSRVLSQQAVRQATTLPLTSAPRQRMQARRHPNATQQHAPAASLASKMPTQRAGQQLQLCGRLSARRRVACLQRCTASAHNNHSSTLLSVLPAVLPPPSAGASPSPSRPIMSCRRGGSDRYR